MDGHLVLPDDWLDGAGILWANRYQGPVLIAQISDQTELAKWQNKEIPKSPTT